MSRGKGVVVGGAVALVFLVFYYYYGGSATPKGQPPLVHLNSATIASLKGAFNGSANSVRILVLLSPT